MIVPSVKTVLLLTLCWGLLYFILFHHYLNSKHLNIQFTHEIERGNSLSFLDIQIKCSNGKFSFSVHHKLIFTGLFTNFESFITLIYKKGLVLTLLFHYLNICSSYTIFHKELEKFESIMIQNGYAIKVLDKFFCPGSTMSSVPKHILLFTLFRFTSKLLNFFLLLSLKLSFKSYLNLFGVFLVFSILKIKFLLYLDPT